MSFIYHFPLPITRPTIDHSFLPTAARHPVSRDFLPPLEPFKQQVPSFPRPASLPPRRDRHLLSFTHFSLSLSCVAQPPRQFHPRSSTVQPWSTTWKTPRMLPPASQPCMKRLNSHPRHDDRIPTASPRGEHSSRAGSHDHGSPSFTTGPIIITYNHHHPA